MRAGGDSARAAPTSGGVSLRVMVMFFARASITEFLVFGGGEAYRLGFPPTKKSV